MYKQTQFLAIIPARGGSKGIPHKNIKTVAGKPLICYTIEAALNSRYIDAVYVSTDDDEIAEISRSAGSGVIMRPDYLASDTSKTVDALIHAAKVVSEQEDGKKYDYLVCLQPTSPLRDSHDIDGAVAQLMDKGQSSLVSLSPVENHPILIRSIDEESDRVKGLLDVSSTVRRQDFPDYYYVNGAIYINRIADLNPDTSLNDNEYGFLMSARHGLDIDEPDDIRYLSSLIEEIKK